MSRTVASLRMGGDLGLVLTIVIGRASFCMHDDTISLTKRVCHSRRCRGSVAWGRMRVLIESQRPRVAMTGQLQRLWGSLVWEWGSQDGAVCDKVSRD